MFILSQFMFIQLQFQLQSQLQFQLHFKQFQLYKHQIQNRAIFELKF